MVDASVGRTTSVSSVPQVPQFLPLQPAAPASLSHATSNTSSFDSYYLPSHHSDDYLYDEPIYELSSPLSTFDDDVGSTVGIGSS